MLKLALSYAHLLAAALAIGLIATTDLKMLVKALGFRVVFAPPSRFEAAVIGLALTVLIVTGAGLIALGLDLNPHYLHNPKLQAKLVLVAALVGNAWVLHRLVFPALARRKPVSRWSRDQVRAVCFSVGLSTFVWLFAAALGLAKTWNFSKSVQEVLLIALIGWLVTALGIRLVLALAAVEANSGESSPAWVLRIKQAANFGLQRPARGSNRAV